MRRKMLLTLLSSWSVNPIGILLLQAEGLGSNSSIKLLFLISGASVGFQLFLNECYALNQSKPEENRLDPFVMSVLTAHLFSSLALCLGQSSPTIYYLAPTGSALGLFLSFRTANTYYEALRRGRISNKESIIIGATPGITSLCLYACIALAPPSLLDMLVAPMLFLPQMAQWAYTHQIAKALNPPKQANKKDYAGTARRIAKMALPLGGIIYLSYKCATVKSILATFNPDFGVALIYATNLALTLMNLGLKAAHLKNGTKAGGKYLHPLILVAFTSMLIITNIDHTSARNSILAVITSQIGLLATLEVGRIILNAEAG